MMLSRKGRRSGFTLIELLIVVAIIAILAAIAVPNFLEAQTRSKAARARSDLRALALAIEMYRSDFNDYVPMGDEFGFSVSAPGPSIGVYGGFFAWLSSPVAYIGNAFLRDPFAKDRRGLTGWSSGMDNYYHYYAFNAGGELSRWTYTDTSQGFYRGQPKSSSNASGYNADVWVLMSNGPDAIRSVAHFPEVDAVDSWRAEHGCAWDDYWVQHRIAGEAVLPNRISALVYDPTNGTTSNGDIFRVGGTAFGGGGDLRLYFQYFMEATAQ